LTSPVKSTFSQHTTPYQSIRSELKRGVFTVSERRYWSVALILLVTLIIVPSVRSYELPQATVTAKESTRGAIELDTPDSGFTLKMSSSECQPGKCQPQGDTPKNVTVLGVIVFSSITPACSLSTPPCAIDNSWLYYVIVNGRNYRLIFSNTTSVPHAVNGWNVIVTGSYITPSAFQSHSWTPDLNFQGDIYVQRISYYRTLPH